MNSARFDSILRQVLVVPVLVVLLGAAALFWQFRDTNRTVARLEASDASIARIQLVERLLADQETGLRGFQTTSNPLFLAPYIASDPQVQPALRALRSSLDPDQANIVSQLESLHDNWEQTFAVPLIATIRAGGRTSGTDLNVRGKNQMDAMRARLVLLSRDARHRRALRIARWQTQVHSMSVALLLIAIAMGLFIGLYLRALFHDLSDAFRRSNTILRLRAEEASRSQQRLGTTLSSIADGVITCSPDGKVQTMNTAAQELTGWTESKARAQSLATVFPVFDESTHEPLQDAITGLAPAGHGAPLTQDALLIRGDGTRIEIEKSIALIRDKRGAAAGFVLVFRDVTMARKSRQALLANEKLAVAGRLAATIAHEIHNPLDSISNLLFLMDGPSTPQENAHFLELARQEIARVTQITRAMLSLYREARAPIPVDLKDMFESILLLMHSRFAGLGVSVQLDLPPGLTVHGFPAELRQVFTNLLANAAEAAPQGHIRLQATPEPDHLSPGSLQPQSGVLVTVADNGPGIPEDVQAHLFQPFFTTKGEQGTGLGLWVSRGIITKHGGQITVSSSTAPETHGTTVAVFLATHPTLQPAGG